MRGNQSLSGLAKAGECAQDVSVPNDIEDYEYQHSDYKGYPTEYFWVASFWFFLRHATTVVDYRMSSNAVVGQYRLRIHVNHANDAIRHRIEAAKQESFRTCEICGQPGSGVKAIGLRLCATSTAAHGEKKIMAELTHEQLWNVCNPGSFRCNLDRSDRIPCPGDRSGVFGLLGDYWGADLGLTIRAW
jgi:hypothetical protein